MMEAVEMRVLAAALDQNTAIVSNKNESTTKHVVVSNRDAVSLLLNPLNHRSNDPFFWYSFSVSAISMVQNMYTRNQEQLRDCPMPAPCFAIIVAVWSSSQDQTPSLAAGDATTRQMKREVFRSECVRHVIITIR
jgi:hypothetical protein